MKIDVLDLIEIAKKAGKAIMEVYSKNFDIEYKEDNSPLTQADKNANEIIVKELLKYGYPIISEESKKEEYNKRKDWNDFFLVDPLDGTKEFISRNGNFTINIAFLKDKKPLLGVIYSPVKDIVYYTDGNKAYKNGEEISWKEGEKTRVVASKNHLNKETEEFIKKLGETEFVSIGSSLKFCLIAEGKADIYPRLGLTSEWDTAAAHAIMKVIGKKVLIYGSEEELKYNKEDLLNPWFVVK